MFRKILLAITALTFVSTLALAEDPIATRKSMMKSVGGAVKTGVGMMKGEMDYDAAKAEELLKTIQETAHNFGNYFPEDSKTGGKTTVAPAIWDDAEGFKAALAKFAGDVDAAVDAKPADLGAFKASFGKVLSNCKACHEKFRVKK